MSEGTFKPGDKVIWRRAFTLWRGNPNDRRTHERIQEVEATFSHETESRYVIKLRDPLGDIVTRAVEKDQLIHDCREGEG